MLERILVALALLAAPTVAAAQEEWVDPDDQARELYSAGELAYGEGRFDDALGLFQRAHELSGRPELLYNVGLAATNAGDERTALAALEAYIAALPEAPNRALVDGRIAGLRREIAEEEATAGRADEERARLAEERERDSRSSADANRSVGWALTVTALVLVGGGIAVLIPGYLDIATVEGAADGTPWTSLRDANTRAPILTGVGYGALGVGCALLGVGLALALGTSDAPSEGGSVALRVGVGSIGLQGAF